MKLSLKEEALKTLKNDTKRIKTKISIYGEADDEGLNLLEEKLEDQEHDENKLKSSLQEKEICVKCLCKHKDECYSSKLPFVCVIHKVYKFVCKFEKSNHTLPLQNNTAVNSTALGNVVFDTEEVIVINTRKMKRVLLTYDSFASHTTMNYAVKEELQLDTVLTHTMVS